MSALNYLFELAMLHGSVSMEGDEPLVRTLKSDKHGQERKLVVKVEMKLPDSVRGGSDPKTDATVVNALNCLLGLGAAFGNNTFMPTEGPQKGLRVTTVGGKGFPQSLDAGNSIVLFGPQTFEPHQDTDDNGEIRIPVQGRRQKRDYPDTAKPVKKEFSVILSSTLEPTGGSSIAKTFLDSLICMGKPGMGCTDAVTDVLKTFHYSLGEHTFAVTDWGGDMCMHAKAEQPFGDANAFIWDIDIRLKDKGDGKEYHGAGTLRQTTAAPGVSPNPAYGSASATVTIDDNTARVDMVVDSPAHQVCGPNGCISIPSGHFDNPQHPTVKLDPSSLSGEFDEVLAGSSHVTIRLSSCEEDGGSK